MSWPHIFIGEGNEWLQGIGKNTKLNAPDGDSQATKPSAGSTAKILSFNEIRELSLASQPKVTYEEAMRQAREILGQSRRNIHPTNAMRFEDPYSSAYERFPRPGAKLRYCGTHEFWFTDIIANAERELRIGQIYSLKTVELASSWASITLEETGDTPFALSFFEALPEVDPEVRPRSG